MADYIEYKLVNKLTVDCYGDGRVILCDNDNRYDWPDLITFPSIEEFGEFVNKLQSIYEDILFDFDEEEIKKGPA